MEDFRKYMIRNLTRYFTVVLFAVLLLLTIFFARKCSKLESDNKILENQNECLEVSNEFWEGNYYIILEKYEKLKEEYNSLSEKYCNTAEKAMEYIEPFKYSDKLNYLLSFKKIVNDYSDYLYKPLTIYDEYSPNEITLMWRAIETEVYDLPFEQKVNIASVILNRLNSDKWSDNAIEVITSPNQFAYHRTNISNDTKLALEYAYMIEDTTDGCIGFRSDKKVENWNGWNCIGYDGFHWFYTDKAVN